MSESVSHPTTARARAKASQDERSNAKHRAIRLKTLREMTGLSRDMIMKRYDIARGTLQNWETARFGGLTVKGANNIIRAFQAEGIRCSIEWLLYGIGPGPQFSDKLSQSVATTLPSDYQNLSQDFEQELGAITQELLYFRQKYAESIDMVVPDDAMLPRYQTGDYVAGVRRYRQDIEKVCGEICIIQTSYHGPMIRELIPGEEPGRYHLMTTHRGHDQTRPVLYNVDIVSAAPIVWSRRVHLVTPPST